MREISQPAVTNRRLPGETANGNTPAGEQKSGSGLLGSPDTRPASAEEGPSNLWALTGPFEEWWMAEYNAEVWGDESWRNDGSGHSYESSVVHRRRP
jgi:hypothetical protein